MKKAVVLLSGGIDSAVCTAIAKESGYKIYTISFDYGQRNKCEIDAAARISGMLGAAQHKAFKVDLSQLGGSAITDRNIEIPDTEEKGVPVTYVPGRNLIFLSVAAAWAETIKAKAIFIGANVRDYSGYPDCRGDFLEAFEKAADLGTKKETKIAIKAPLLLMTKAKIVKESSRLGIDLDLTTSCYNPLNDGSPCGKCASCRIRERALKKASVKTDE